MTDSNWLPDFTVRTTGESAYWTLPFDRISNAGESRPENHLQIVQTCAVQQPRHWPSHFYRFERKTLSFRVGMEANTWIRPFVWIRRCVRAPASHPTDIGYLIRGFPGFPAIQSLSSLRELMPCHILLDRLRPQRQNGMKWRRRRSGSST
jgi:hypothetical protein